MYNINDIYIIFVQFCTKFNYYHLRKKSQPKIQKSSATYPRKKKMLKQNRNISNKSWIYPQEI